jgi:acyl-CoA thioesterase-2
MSTDYKSINHWHNIAPLTPGTMDGDGSGYFIRCRGIASVWLGDTLLARTADAIITAPIEAHGQILIPLRDVLERGDGSDASLAIERHNTVEGEEFVCFDAARTRVEIDDHWGGDPLARTINLFPRWGDMRDLVRLVDVEPAGDKRFVGPTYGDLRRNVVEGGQLIAQCLVAAAKATPGKRVISIHIILSRPAVFDIPMDFDVETYRAGRQFATLAVNATQAGKPIASALVLLDAGAPDVMHGQCHIPDVPGPEESPFYDFGVLGRASRFVNGDYDPDPNRIGPPELNCWVRHRENPEELYLRQALLAQSITHFTIAAAMLPHEGIGEALAHHSLSTGVVAVTLSLHEDPDLTDWILYHNPAIYAGRGLAQGDGRIFAKDGRLLASFTTQVMIRGFDRQPGEIGLNSTRLM